MVIHQKELISLIETHIFRDTYTMLHYSLCTSYLKPIGYTSRSIGKTMNLSVKDPLKKHIKRFETHVHNRLERKGLTDFRSGITLDHISHALVTHRDRPRISF